MAGQENQERQESPIAPEKNTAATSLDPKKADGFSAVRFASVNEEIEPAKIDSTPSSSQAISGNEAEKLKEISQTLHGTRLQERRMSHFAFEPVSLPASRVCRPLSLIKSGVSERVNLGSMLILHGDLSCSPGRSSAFCHFPGIRSP
ncbi:hypothetical protein NA56DRAFT_209419 [Hyaloscypha hepaticicola]|uniref:Uncharacterized protein n=1 Tax=Hyaloscypha hepaticicola TaxID=2082293 RepID=A0A2J6PXZ6_9HELO|nr:hypothetical protein NA56DRAFT_209419 [Hyaloscypha hepaticicola]